MKKTTNIRFVLIILLQFTFSYSSYAEGLSPEEVDHAHQELNELIERVNDVYRPIFRKNFLRFKINTHFDNDLAREVDDRVQYWMSPASANLLQWRKGQVEFRGETMALEHVTKDVGALIICHEIGHLIGGAPMHKKLSSEGMQVTSEGQADYFSTLKCVKRLWQVDEVQVLKRDQDIPLALWNQCLLQYESPKDQAICQRTLNAINDLTKTYFYMRLNGEIPVSLNDHSTQVASVTLDNYPDEQCRIDILVAGALCNKKGKLSKIDPTRGVCAEENGDIIGVRPHCWYHPLSLQDKNEFNNTTVLEKIRASISD